MLGNFPNRKNASIKVKGGTGTQFFSFEWLQLQECHFLIEKQLERAFQALFRQKKLNFDLIIPFFGKKMSNLQKIVEAQLTRFYYFVDAIVCLKALLTFCQRRFLIN